MRNLIAVIAVVSAGTLLGGCAGGIGNGSMIPNASQSIHSAHPLTLTGGPTPATLTGGPTPAGHRRHV